MRTTSSRHDRSVADRANRAETRDAVHDAPGDAARDDGTILVLTLLLTVVLAAIVMMLATYATTGLTTSRITTDRTESNAAATAGLTWAIEEFAKKQIVPEDPADCDSAPVTLPIPAGLADGVQVTCTTEAMSAGSNPQVRLEATAPTARGGTRTIEVLLEVPAQQYTTQVNSWVVG